MAGRQNEELVELFQKLDKFGKDTTLIDRADALDRGLSRISPEGLFEQFTI